LSLLLALGLGACDEEPADYEQTRSAALPPTEVELGAESVDTPDDGFVYATGVTMLRAHAPTRFEARLPGRFGGFAEDGSVGDLPSAYFEARLCANDGAMRARVLHALTPSGWLELDSTVLDAYVDLLSRCPSTRHCAWLAETARSEHRAVVPMTGSMLWCERGAFGDLFAREDVPPRAAVIWMRNNVDPVGEVPAELERAVRAVIADRHEIAFTDATVALARYRGKAAASLIAELQEASDRIAAEAVDGYGYGGEAPELLARACEFLLVAPQCADLPGYREVSDVDVIVTGTQEQYEQALLDPKRAAKVGDLLTACVRDPEQVEARRAHCLARLAARDWTLARAVAAPLSTVDPAFHEALRILGAFESRAAFRRELADLGLVGDHEQPTFQETISVADELYRARRLHVFAGRSGTVPVRHDVLLFQLAGLAGRAMIDVVFEELPPSDIDDIYSTSPHVLRAYADGKRWSVVADATDDFYDVRQTIGLLNVVAAERGSELRWAALPDDDAWAVIVAPRDGIRAAAARGYIELADL
jgi:hypothetical protein